MAGIAKTLETLDSIGKLSVSMIVVVKAGGFKLSLLPKLVEAVTQIGVVIAAAPQALPELADLDEMESKQLGGAAYKLVKDIVTALA